VNIDQFVTGATRLSRAVTEPELVIGTLRDAEPWIEVFRDVSNFVVKQRIT